MQLHHSTIREAEGVLRVTGELDLRQAPRLARAVDVLVEAGTRRLVLDLTDLDFIDSTCVGLIVPRLRALRRHGGDIVVAAAAPRIVRPFTVTGTDAVLAVVPSVADALSVVELHGARTRRQAQRPAATGTRRKAS